MPGQSPLAPVIGESVIELEIAPTAGPGWLGTGAAPVTVSLTAETVRLDGTHLHFLTGDTVVRTVPREDVAAMTWKGHPPRRRRPATATSVRCGPTRNANGSRQRSSAT